MAKKHVFNLVELTAGPWNGQVHRSESMTEAEARRRNARMSGTVIKWEKAGKD